MTWPNAFSAESILPHNCGDLVYYPACQSTFKAALGIAKITSPRPTPSLPQPLDYRRNEAMALKAAMQRDRDQAIRRMDCRAVKQIESDLAAVTRTILSRGA